MKRLLLMATWLALATVQGSAQAVEPSALVNRYAMRYNLEPEFISAFIDVESQWNRYAVSSMGARGLMQLMPETARRFGAFDPFDPEQNIAAGTRYLTALMWEFHGDMRMVAAAYYSGEKWVGKRQLNYRNADVIAYVESIRRHYLKRRSTAARLPEK
ncbi:MAG TPA: lytic transglycosylase domain-containing protein [Edaphobacter sp.]|jgi:soluble lytic murein transglycosylase-like protein|nr:lytic transglycosylase domain-containing protein [Edaphobacter sp.]